MKPLNPEYPSLHHDDGERHTKPQISGVPQEVWYEIAAQLRTPADILSLLSTCSSLHEMLQERTTWVALLRALCYHRSIFFSSYPIDEMSIERIRRACMGPSLYAQLLETNSAFSIEKAPIEPSSNTYLKFGDPRIRYEEAFLVPGGRFLIQTRQGHLEIWDLGPPDAPALENPVLLCQSSTEPHPLINHVWCDALAVRMIDEETLRIAVGSGYTTVKVYDAKLGSANPALRVIGTLVLDIDASRFDNLPREMYCCDIQLTDEVAVIEIRHARHAIIWSFAAGWYALSPITGGFFERRPHPKIIVDRDTVVEFLAYDGVTVWSIAESELLIHPVVDGMPIDLWEVTSPFSDAPFERNYPLPEIEDDDGLGAQFALPMTTWSSTHEQPVLFDVILGGDPDLNEPFALCGFRYALSIHRDLDGSLCPRYTLQQTFHLPKLQLHYRLQSHPPGRVGYGFGTGCGIMFSRERCHVELSNYVEGLSMYSLPPQPKAMLTTTGNMGDGGGEERRLSNEVPLEACLTRLLDTDHAPPPSLCMASGRMYCGVTVWDSLTEGSSVSDFLPPWNG